MQRVYWVGGAIVFLLYAGFHLYQGLHVRELGAGKAYEPKKVSEGQVKFLADRTFLNADGERVIEQQIFDEVFRMIDEAEEYILLDMFLFNEFQGLEPERQRALASELTQALVRKKADASDLPAMFITDPVNTVYGGVVSPHLAQLESVGVDVVVTDLTRMRDSNPLYSIWWRMGIRWFGNDVGGRIMPNPFQVGERVSLRSWLSLLNFKGNHRKVLVVDDDVLVTSANPHDGSSAHGNVALRVDGALSEDVKSSEALVGAAVETGHAPSLQEGSKEDVELLVQYVTDRAIRTRLIELLRRADVGDRVDIAMFYLSERLVIDELVAAAERGARIRLLLDPNKDAFGRTKNGVPNRPVAHELLVRSPENVEVRWCDTHGEQCHSKLVLFDFGNTRAVTLGSANLTRRNIGGYNLEANIFLEGSTEARVFSDIDLYFNEHWENQDERVFSTDYAVYGESGLFKTILYWLQERTGLSSF